MEQTFSPCPYCDRKDNNCAGCELQAYRAIMQNADGTHRLTLEKLGELVGAKASGMSIVRPCLKCKHKWHLDHSTPTECYNPCHSCGYNLNNIVWSSNYENDEAAMEGRDG